MTEIERRFRFSLSRLGRDYLAQTGEWASMQESFAMILRWGVLVATARLQWMATRRKVSLPSGVFVIEDVLESNPALDHVDQTVLVGAEQLTHARQRNH